MRQIEFFFDYISPYAYLAWEDAQRIAREHEVELVAKPILFAALLNHNDTRGPAEIESKRRYLFVDILRKAEALGVEINVPATHPFNPLLALRVTCAADMATRSDVVSKLYAAVWRDAADMNDAETYEALGLGAPLAKASNAEVKQELRSNTEEAIRDGIFGVPTLRCDGELFWGVDNLPFLEDHLSGKSGPDVEKLKRWNTLEASATRPRK
ncbi:MAG: 2-hydroxychromene-2-carboxylate isomerase [Polyangiales bacterium]